MRRLTTATAALALAGLLLTGCTDEEAPVPDQTPASRESAPAESAPAEEAPAEDEEAETATLPDMVGKGLQAAQDAAQEAGFYALTSHDALGRDRMQAMDRNWKVCFQTPGAGEHPADTEVDFAAVKLEEKCPAQDDVSAPGEAAQAGTMPDLVGESAKAARGTLPTNASIIVTDVSGQDRMVLMESNWQICAQAPAAGDPFDGDPVTLDVVKFEETCP
ncbi:PASTA domain-containing protein [Streptomyces sp. TRM 70351]|uniref:PASTA domain-containing protein n=1 Tax=Streptomyces sp. TRM 70351 TaxID=3116552 RepID=UPI002E7C1DAA|nr:PASTA domain-containing protein [Streptomyces sp. TRM 70351]MEE1927359.1 PASTA domain-containing protein [Streptomyces sp. TRM 70351]